MYLEQPRQVYDFPMKCFHPDCHRILRKEQIENLLHASNAEDWFSDELATRIVNTLLYQSWLAKHNTHQLGKNWKETLQNFEMVSKVISQTEGTMASFAICPGCKMIINKDGGCNHMECLCGCEFEWSAHEIDWAFRIQSYPGLTFFEKSQAMIDHNKRSFPYRFKQKKYRASKLPRLQGPKPFGLMSIDEDQPEDFFEIEEPSSNDHSHDKEHEKHDELMEAWSTSFHDSPSLNDESCISFSSEFSLGSESLQLGLMSIDEDQPEDFESEEPSSNDHSDDDENEKHVELMEEWGTSFHDSPSLNDESCISFSSEFSLGSESIAASCPSVSSSWSMILSDGDASIYALDDVFSIATEDEPQKVELPSLSYCHVAKMNVAPPLESRESGKKHAAMNASGIVGADSGATAIKPTDRVLHDDDSTDAISLFDAAKSGRGGKDALKFRGGHARMAAGSWGGWCSTACNPRKTRRNWSRKRRKSQKARRYCDGPPGQRGGFLPTKCALLRHYEIAKDSY
eukprot:CAMPEP_0172472220 /NCGR_PEP_ID=MMETSP1065-20121228/68224_1 /TAXON_ID=265537 /ORGANISM="Amphiprora paludosa, Strain CCMP125" /LENGTH=513 /DNA_ID=CAMNT_0013230351 /DNA_START=191 /DNA_END=1733 /DNA_ORIENTATION=+